MTQPPASIRLSRFLSLASRHDPAAGVTLDGEGGASVWTIDRRRAGHRPSIAHQALHALVRDDSGRRYAPPENGVCIRANQGHSVTVALRRVPVASPEPLYHGTLALWPPRSLPPPPPG